MKEQEKRTPEKNSNETKITTLADKEFKETVIRMLNKLERTQRAPQQKVSTKS